MGASGPAPPACATEKRRFLFLQGPHGPFFAQLGRLLSAAGAQVLRVGFNAGDAAFWYDSATYYPFTESPEDWPETLDGILSLYRPTDLVLYGDTRPVHAIAVAAARRRGLTIHVFEEGYLRPFWITYERNGSNGNSRLCDINLAEMQAGLRRAVTRTLAAPTHWGDTRQHMFYGALYHWYVLFRNRRYPAYRTHREIPVARELRLNLHRLAARPVQGLRRRAAERRILRRGAPFHLALLQLEHDASFRHHGPFASMTEFIETCITGFATGAPGHHHLVFKAHPLEDGRAPIERTIREAASRQGVSERVHFVPAGRLAALLDAASSAITINSTAGQQVLWRGLPLKAFGQAVYSRPEFVSGQPLPDFFADPVRPDRDSYLTFRAFLLRTSQVPGGYYSASGRAQALRRICDMMLAPGDPYDHCLPGKEPSRPRLRVAL